MRVALFTYFASSSYGATLQTYATIRILKDLGHEVCLVNYVIPEPPRFFLISCLLFLKMRRLKSFRKKYYEEFLSQPYKTFEDLQNCPPVADAYLIGSDQTWNTEISREKARGYFLDFGDDKVRRVTYAASFGKGRWDDTPWMNKEDANRLLHQFDKILVREQSGKIILREVFGIEADRVLDPVLLFTEYPEITGRIIEGNELVTFKLKDSDLFYEKMTILSRSLGIPARILGSLRRKKGYRCAYPEGLEEWLRAIASSKYMITDSFHGIVVSLLYHRQFLACMAIPERFARLKDLLVMLGLEERIFSENDDANVIKEKMLSPIDWKEIDSKLDKYRKESIRLLKEELS